MRVIVTRPDGDARRWVRLLAQSGIGLRQVVDAMLQSIEVQHRAADQDRYFATRADLGHQAHRITTKLRSGVAFFWADNIDQMVRRTQQGLGIRLGGTDIHITEHQG